jgi:AcrR family transcriptional regulator
MPARNVRKDVARNRERIIDAARIVFREHGISAPVATIARTAGVARPRSTVTSPHAMIC